MPNPNGLVAYKCTTDGCSCLIVCIQVDTVWCFLSRVRLWEELYANVVWETK